MKYQTGDKILVLLTQEEGKVVEIMNEKMVMIEVKGVRFPAYMDQIDFPYFKMFTEKRQAEKRKIFIDDVRPEKKGQKVQVDQGVFLSFMPVFDKDIFDDDVVEKFKLFLINQTGTAYQFTYRLFFSGVNNFELKNTVEPFSDFYLHNVEFDSLSDNPRFDFEFSLVNPDKQKAPFYEASLKIKAKQLFKKIEELQEKNEPMFSYELFHDYPNKTEDEQPDYSMINNPDFKLYDAGRIKEHLPPARSVVDLHIEKLTDNPTSLSKREMLSIQLKAFDRFYELAVAHRQPTLTIIHGIGAGRLKDEIHDILKAKKEVKSFVNQYNPSYGFGATEIFFK